MGGNLFDVPVVGGVTLGLFLTVNIIVVRYVMQYMRETREEYVKKMTQAIIEAEYQKTENMRLRYQLERLGIRVGKKII
jgi:hypothetical protein